MSASANVGYIKDRLRGTSDPPTSCIYRGSKGLISKDRVLILDLPDPGLAIDKFPSYITGIEMTPLLEPGAARGREKKRVGERGEFTGAHVCATLNPLWEDFTVTTGSQSMRFLLRMVAKSSPSQPVVWQM